MKLCLPGLSCSLLITLYLGCIDLKSALGKKRRDGKNAALKPLTTIQRLHVLKLVEKYGDDYQVGCELFISELLTPWEVLASESHVLIVLQSMFMDTKLNSMQHSVGTLEKLCKRYHLHKDKNPLILTGWARCSFRQGSFQDTPELWCYMFDFVA